MAQITRLWNYRNVQTRREERDAQARRFNEATAAETRLADVVRNECGYEGIRMRVRVPRYRREDDTGGRGEVDMILVNENGIYVIEIKDFVGQVYTSGNANGEWKEWVQYARRENSGEKIYIKHGDLLGGITLKAKAVADYLMRVPIPNAADAFSDRHHLPDERHRLDLPPGVVIPCLVFVNPNCVVDPQTLARHQFVFTTDSFKKFVGARSALYDWGAWLAPILVPANKLTYNQQLGALSIVDTLPTWDTIIFHNGSVRTGDVQQICFPESKVKSNPVVPFLDRKNVANISMTWPSTRFVGLLWTLATHSDLPTAYVYLKPGTQVPIGLAPSVLTGDDARKAASTADRNDSSSPYAKRRGAGAGGGGGRGGRGGGGGGRGGYDDIGALPNDQVVMLKFPLGSQPGEPARSTNVAFIKFKSAGTNVVETIALHHLDSISLSPVPVATHNRGPGALPGDR